MSISINVYMPNRVSARDFGTFATVRLEVENSEIDIFVANIAVADAIVAAFGAAAEPDPVNEDEVQF